ncbi:hypothetical protein [Streptomyces sp. ISL-98]|nr:hypothetical protein [Streptomyces sp. ISL-98]
MDTRDLRTELSWPVADWLAKAANKQLTFPSDMPERSPQGSWRDG